MADPHKQTSAPAQANLLSQKKLFRSTKSRVIAGVAGGLGEYFGFDPNIARILFVLFSTFDGIGVLVYLIMWIVVPLKTKTSESVPQTIQHNLEEIKQHSIDVVGRSNVPVQISNNRNWWAIIFISIGIMLLLNNFNFFGHFGMGKLWPLLLIVIGIIIFRNRQE